MLSYVAVVALVLAVSALAVHFAFVAILMRNVSARLQSIGEVAQSVVDWVQRAFPST